MTALGKFKGPLKCIPYTMEKYLTFSLGNLSFKDSLQFMPSSLDQLVENLKKKGRDNFPLLDDEFGNHADLFIRKGVYPYEFMDRWERFDDTQLPPKDAFYSELKQEGISDEDYAYAMQVWNTTGMKTLGDYHDVYLRSDTLLLASVFEAFRDVCLEVYHLDPAHYLSSPGNYFSLLFVLYFNILITLLRL